jgi:hypothetical protein
MSKYILEGVFTTFDYKPNGRIYDKEGFNRHLKIYQVQLQKINRQIKLQKILKFI